MCPHSSVTGSSSTSQHTAQLQLPWISGSRARLCPALLEAAALPSVFCPPVELVAPLVRAMVACVALLSHCLDGMQRAAAHRRSGKTRVGDGEQSTAVMCELHPSCTMGLRYDASALSGSGMYQKDAHTRVSLCGSCLQHRLLVVLSSRGCQGVQPCLQHGLCERPDAHSSSALGVDRLSFQAHLPHQPAEVVPRLFQQQCDVYNVSSMWLCLFCGVYVVAPCTRCHSVAPACTRASTAASWFLARAAARGVRPLLSARLISAPACNSARMASTRPHSAAV